METERREDRAGRHRLRLILLLVPIGVFTIMSNVGGYGGPAIVAHHPLLEIWLNPTNRYLALAAANRFVDRYQWWLVGLSLAIGAWQFSRRRVQKNAAAPETEPR